MSGTLVPGDKQPYQSTSIDGDCAKVSLESVQIQPNPGERWVAKLLANNDFAEFTRKAFTEDVSNMLRKLSRLYVRRELFLKQVLFSFCLLWLLRLKFY